VIRRAVVHGRDLELQGFLPQLADVVVEQMGDVYPELAEHRDEITGVLRGEEEKFGETLTRGLKLFEETSRDGVISGEEAFVLQATYGFPIEMTVELARERGQDVDLDGFQKAMAEHREISRGEAAGSAVAEAAADLAASAGFRTEFVGYEKTEVLTQLGAIQPLEGGLFLGKLRESPFYPEGGGQVSDQGWIELDGARAELVSAFRFGDDQVLLFEGEGFEAGQRVRAVVPWKVRFPTMANHTATHLLHKALQDVLGDHVRQAGSAVRPDKLRFDFTHGQALTSEERERVVEHVNERVFENHPVRAFLTPIDEARNLGAMMLFGEKYGDIVRVLEVEGVSRELCGGTHVRSTAEVGPFVILSEASVGSGVRRIEAVTAGEAFAYLRGKAHEAEELRGELAAARKQASRKAAPQAGPEVVDERRSKAGEVEVIVMEIAESTPDALLELSDTLRQRHAPAAVVLGTRENGRVHLVVSLDRSLEDRGLDAVQVVRQAAALVGGGGGGRPTMARAGGKDPEKLGDALAEAEKVLLDALG
jgi:alanyl-tRNA synthetase